MVNRTWFGYNALERPKKVKEEMMPEPEITTLRLDRPGIRAALGDLEAEAMEAVWRRPAGAGLTIREELQRTRPLMYTTIGEDP